MPEAIRKGTEQAKRNLFKIPLDKGTIPHEVLGQLRRRPGAAQPGRAPVPASSPAARVRPVLEVAGMHGHPDQVHRHLEPAQRHPRDGRRRCSRCARAEEALRARGKTLESLHAVEDRNVMALKLKVTLVRAASVAPSSRS